MRGDALWNPAFRLPPQVPVLTSSKELLEVQDDITPPIVLFASVVITTVKLTRTVVIRSPTNVSYKWHAFVFVAE